MKRNKPLEPLKGKVLLGGLGQSCFFGSGGQQEIPSLNKSFPELWAESAFGEGYDPSGVVIESAETGRRGEIRYRSARWTFITEEHPDFGKGPGPDDRYPITAKDRMAGLLRDGWSVTDAAERAGMPYASAYAHAKTIGWNIRWRKRVLKLHPEKVQGRRPSSLPVPEQTRREVEELGTYEAVGKKYGVTRERVRQVVGTGFAEGRKAVIRDATNRVIRAKWLRGKRKARSFRQLVDLWVEMANSGDCLENIASATGHSLNYVQFNLRQRFRKNTLRNAKFLESVTGSGFRKFGEACRRAGIAMSTGRAIAKSCIGGKHVLPYTRRIRQWSVVDPGRQHPSLTRARSMNP